MKALRGVLLAGAASLLLVSAAASQGPVPRLGVVAGFAFADLGGDDAEDVDTRTGFLFGGFGDFSFGNNVGFRPELLLVQKGGSDDTEDIDCRHSSGRRPLRSGPGPGLREPRRRFRCQDPYVFDLRRRRVPDSPLNANDC